MAIKVLNTDPQQPVIDSKTEKVQTLSFRRNDYENSPDEDTFEKTKNNTVKKVAISTAVLVGLAVLGDVLFADGKHIKKIFGKAEKDAKKAGEGKKPETKPDNKPNEGTKPEGTKESKETKDPEGTKEPGETKKSEGTKESGEAKSPEGVKENSSSDQPATLFEFEHDGNRFVVSENREIISYKNAQGEELIEKYRNPESDGDKVYKATIDEALNKHLAERDSKIAEEEAKKAAGGNKPEKASNAEGNQPEGAQKTEETQAADNANNSSDSAPENAQ